MTQLRIGEDVALDVEVLGQLERAVAFRRGCRSSSKAQSAAMTDAGQQQMDDGAAVGAAELDRLAAVLGLEGAAVVRGLTRRDRCRWLVQPSGTRIRALRLRSLQQTRVGASWLGTRRR